MAYIYVYMYIYARKNTFIEKHAGNADIHNDVLIRIKTGQERREGSLYHCRGGGGMLKLSAELIFHVFRKYFNAVVSVTGSGGRARKAFAFIFLVFNSG